MVQTSGYRYLTSTECTGLCLRFGLYDENGADMQSMLQAGLSCTIRLIHQYQGGNKEQLPGLKLSCPVGSGKHVGLFI